MDEVGIDIPLPDSPVKEAVSPQSESNVDSEPSSPIKLEKSCYEPLTNTTVLNDTQTIYTVENVTKVPVLSMAQAKKRLKAFLTKNQMLLSPQLKKTPTPKAATEELTPKKTKKVQENKAKAVIEEIETMKKAETAYIEALNQRLANSHNRRKRSRSRSKERKQRKRMYKSRHEPSNDPPKPPESWADVPDDFFNNTEKDTKNVRKKRSRIESFDYRRMLHFSSPSLMLRPFIYKNLKGEERKVPSAFVRYTNRSPAIAYSVNFHQIKNVCLTRKEILHGLPKSIRENFESIFKENKHINKKEEEIRRYKSRPWYPKIMGTPPECEIIENSFGLSILKNYTDMEEDKQPEKEHLKDHNKTEDNNDLNIKTISENTKTKTEHTEDGIKKPKKQHKDSHKKAAKKAHTKTKEKHRKKKKSLKKRAKKKMKRKHPKETENNSSYENDSRKKAKSDTHNDIHDNFQTETVDKSVIDAADTTKKDIDISEVLIEKTNEESFSKNTESKQKKHTKTTIEKTTHLYEETNHNPSSKPSEKKNTCNNSDDFLNETHCNSLITVTTSAEKRHNNKSTEDLHNISNEIKPESSDTDKLPEKKKKKTKSKDINEDFSETSYHGEFAEAFNESDVQKRPKTPDTDDYYSHWESDDGITPQKKPNRSWESDEEIFGRPAVMETTSKRNISSPERTLEMPLTLSIQPAKRITFKKEVIAPDLDWDIESKADIELGMVDALEIKKEPEEMDKSTPNILENEYEEFMKAVSGESSILDINKNSTSSSDSESSSDSSSSSSSSSSYSSKSKKRTKKIAENSGITDEFSLSHDSAFSNTIGFTDVPLPVPSPGVDSIPMLPLNISINPDSSSNNLESSGLFELDRSKPLSFPSLKLPMKKNFLTSNKSISFDDNSNSNECEIPEAKKIEDENKVESAIEDVHHNKGVERASPVHRRSYDHAPDHHKRRKKYSRDRHNQEFRHRDQSPRRRTASPKRRNDASPRRRDSSPHAHKYSRHKRYERRDSSPSHKHEISPRRFEESQRRYEESPRRHEYKQRRRENSPKVIRSHSPSSPSRRSYNRSPNKSPADSTMTKTSPINSPLDGFKRSVADSTISDDLLPQPSNEYLDSPVTFNSYYQDSPKSPKRIPLDDRINQVLGIEKEQPKTIETTYSQESYYNNPQYYAHQYNQYYDQNYIPQPTIPPNKVVQVGNILQVVPTEDTTLATQTGVTQTQQKETPPMIVQVGNVLEIVPTVNIEKKRVEPVTAPETVPETAPKLTAEALMKQKNAERKAEREKRRQERELRRKEKERKRKEREKRKQQKRKLKTENMIKKALMLETENLLAEEEVETLDEEGVPPIQWPPVPIVVNNTTLKPAGKGILISHGFSKLNVSGKADVREIERKKSVKFADGICPGEGTSPSGGEELSSPPPAVKTLPKEKRFKRIKAPKKSKSHKKKIKVKIIRKKEEDDDDDSEEDNLPPPSPPPGSPPPHIFPPRMKTHTLNNVRPNYLSTMSTSLPIPPSSVQSTNFPPPTVQNPNYPPPSVHSAAFPPPPLQNPAFSMPPHAIPNSFPPSFRPNMPLLMAQSLPRGLHPPGNPMTAASHQLPGSYQNTA